MSRPLTRLFSQRLTASPCSSFRSQSRNVISPSARVFGRRSYASGESGPNPRPGQSPFKVWPFIAITVLSSGAYALMVRSRAGTDMTPAIEAPKSSGRLSAPKKDTPTFSSSNVTVLFVLGGPGAGKGTQCANLVRDYGFTHLSAGDLLRAEQDRAGSQFGSLIKDCIKNGTIVPMEVTVQLLENAMTESLSGSKTRDPKQIDGGAVKGKFLIDGFPRKMDQAEAFEDMVCKARSVLFFDCPEEEMQKRLLKRGETSGRTDDNAESIKKRFKTFVETSMPVVDYYDKQGKVMKVLAIKAPDEVYKDVQKQLETKLGKDL